MLEEDELETAEDEEDELGLLLRLYLRAFLRGLRFLRLSSCLFLFLTADGLAPLSFYEGFFLSTFSGEFFSIIVGGFTASASY